MAVVNLDHEAFIDAVATAAQLDAEGAERARCERCCRRLPSASIAARRATWPPVCRRRWRHGSRQRRRPRASTSTSLSVRVRPTRGRRRADRLRARSRRARRARAHGGARRAGGRGRRAVEGLRGAPAARPRCRDRPGRPLPRSGGRAHRRPRRCPAGDRRRARDARRADRLGGEGPRPDGAPADRASRSASARHPAQRRPRAADVGRGLHAAHR